MIAALTAAVWLTVSPSASAVGPGVTARPAATYDSREAGPLTFRRSASPATVAAREAYERRLGGATAVTSDVVTGALDAVARPGAALTASSGADRGAVARGWAKSHLDVLGLSAAAVDALGAPQVRRTSGGMAALRYVQRYRGIPAFDNALEVTLDRANRVVAAGGSPVASLAVASTTPRLSAAQAAAAIGAPAFGRPRLTIFTGAAGPVLAWRMQVPVSGAEDYDAVVDATTGALLYRQNLVKFLDAEVFREYPGSAAGTQTVDLAAWLDPGETAKLQGPYAHAYADVDDDNAAGTGEEVVPDDHPFNGRSNGTGGCDPAFLCSWKLMPANSWTDNKDQNAVQAFALVNIFREHLAAAPIGFSGDVAFEGDDPVLVETDDGAALDGGKPDADHLNNANMNTQPQGTSPRMQMYLFHGAGYRDINGGDDAATVWHEYTHGLSNRLIVDADGVGALGTAQAGAMGEAWSDWYAEDHLVALGYEIDTAAQGEIDLGKYSDATPHKTRTEALDCKPAPSGQYPTPDPACPGAGTAGPGGYTYGDFGKIFATGPEVHADGEIWGQTLWDLREALGSSVAEQVITEAMRISPPEPSMLDMRNAILAVTSNDFAGSLDTVWQVFADRGMGYYAATTGGSDIAPVEDSLVPPVPGSGEGTISGLVTDARTGAPLAGATVSVAGHDTALNGTYPAVGKLVATTGSDGRYTVTAPPATYPTVVVSGPEPYVRDVRHDVEVADGQATTLDVPLDLDWAFHKGLTTSDNGGASFGCGAAALVDHQADSVWSATNDQDANSGPQTVVDLGQRVLISGFGLDPGAACGDHADAMTKAYKLETSADGVVWAVAKNATFSSSAAGKITRVTPDIIPAQGARFVRLTLLAARTSDSDFVDFAALEVYGAPGPEEPPIITTPTTQTTTTQPPTTPTQTTPPTQTTTTTTTPPPVAPPKLGTLPRKGKKGTYKISVVCPQSCTLDGTLTITSKLRRTLKLKKARVYKVRKVLPAGRKALTFRLSSATLKALKKHRRKTLPATLKLAVKQADGQAVRATKKVSISRT